MPSSSGRYRSGLIGVFSCAVAASVLARTYQQQERSAIADRYKWNLADIYPSEPGDGRDEKAPGRDAPEVDLMHREARPQSEINL